MADKFYVTTSIPYVNGDPHLGHAMEFLQADVLARRARIDGKRVIFSTGTDEHGGKQIEKAAELKITTQEFVDRMSQKFKDLLKDLNVSNDRFIRTTDMAHKKRAQAIWQKLSADIYKSKYEGWYCTGCEEFYTETTVKANNGVCPEHNRPYEKLAEENYFFKLSKYTDQIKKVIDSNQFRIIPTTRKHEILSVINEGLVDISISRPKDKIGWGVTVPGDETQVMYVWFEALMNYITVLGYPEHADFKTFWPADVQVVGKGILRFHGAIWPAMLMALNLPLPGTLFAHGYVTVNGAKMSKSLDNSISPHQIIGKYGVDAFRYYFLRHVPSYNDGDFSWEKLEEAYNNELANDLGNAVQRTAVMIRQYQQGLVGDSPPAEHDTAGYRKALDDCRFDRALEEVWEQVRGLNQYIDDTKPWEVAKSGDTDHLREILAYQVSCLLEIADLLEPFMPATTASIRNIFKEGVVREAPKILFPRLEPTKTPAAS